MSPCHNLEPSLVARDSSRLLSVKPNQWTHLSPFIPVCTGSGSGIQNPLANFIGVFSQVRDDRGFQVNPLCRHVPIRERGLPTVCNLDVLHHHLKTNKSIQIYFLATAHMLQP